MIRYQSSNLRLFELLKIFRQELFIFCSNVEYHASVNPIKAVDHLIGYKSDSNCIENQETNIYRPLDSGEPFQQASPY